MFFSYLYIRLYLQCLEREKDVMVQLHQTIRHQSRLFTKTTSTKKKLHKLSQLHANF